MDAIRIMLVDDHQVVREGLRRMLELEQDMKVIAEASSGQEALAQARALSPEIVLMDIKMPGMDGIEATRLLKQQNPECKVVVLTLYNEYLPHAAHAGADGYLLKDLRREELVRAIRDVREGRSPLHLSVEQGQLEGLVAGVYSPQRYSERELAVLRLVANGVSGREIAQQLAMSEATVKRTLRQIFDKLGTRNRSEAVAEAMRRNLI
ncbi:response regulator [Chloroflexota bacterium]